MTRYGCNQVLIRGASGCVIGFPPKSRGNINNSWRSYFTNAQRVRNDDPYATLGLHYGATQSEIKGAFRKLASQLHPDVNKIDEPAAAQKKFQKLSAAYEKLTKSTNGHPNLDDDEWQWSIWLRSSCIAESRTDVAGVFKVRPIPPATSIQGNGNKNYAIGHPAGFGAARRGEYIGQPDNAKQPTSSVGSGVNKWVERKPYQPWKVDNK